MSHLKERKEKNCLNCNAQVQGKYCHICGQENIEPKENAWHLVTHFFNDITHFDGKFFSTLKLLMTKPGYLSNEYLVGRRTSYLNPIRMYIFTSAIFFLIFFSTTHIDTMDIEEKRTAAEIMAALKRAEAKNVKAIAEQDDSLLIQVFRNRLLDIRNDIKTLEKDSTNLSNLTTRNSNMGFNIGTANYSTVQQYDSAQKMMPAKERDGWLAQLFMRRTLSVKEKYKDRSIQNVLMNKFLHLFPQMLFISLPLFALLLKLLYFRRKQFYYVNHGIFSIHFYIFSFITILIVMGINRLEEWTYWGSLNVFIGVIIAGIFFYLYKAMRSFYQQRRAKTIVKFLLLNLSALFMFLLLFTLFFIFSFFQI